MTDKQTQLAWLDKQRSIVNDMIVNLPPDEQRKLLPELQVINAVAERVREMTAVEYLETFREIVDAYCSDEVGCRECPFGGGDFSVNVQCAFDETTKHPRRTVEIVKRWKEEQDEAR